MKKAILKGVTVCILGLLILGIAGNSTLASAETAGQETSQIVSRLENGSRHKAGTVQLDGVEFTVYIIDYPSWIQDLIDLLEKDRAEFTDVFIAQVTEYDPQRAKDMEERLREHIVLSALRYLKDAGESVDLLLAAFNNEQAPAPQSDPGPAAIKNAGSVELERLPGPYGFDIDHAIDVDYQNPDYMVAGSLFYVYVTENFGQYWKETPTPNGSSVSVIEIDDANPDNVYIGLKCYDDISSRLMAVGISHDRLDTVQWYSFGIPANSVNIADINYRSATHTLYACAMENGLYKSDNDGESWEKVEIPGVSIVSSILLRENDRILLGTDIGIVSTDSACAKFEVVMDKVKLEYIELFDHHESENYIIGLDRDDCSWGYLVFSASDGEKWKTSGTHCGNEDLDIVVRDGKPVFYNAEHPFGLFRSDDLGDTWKLIETGKINRIADIFILNAEEMILGAGSNNNLYYFNTDRTMEPIIGNINRKRIDSVLFDGDKVLLPPTEGGLMYTNDLGETWNACISDDLYYADEVMDLEQSEIYPNEIYAATYCADIWKSTDGGVSWTDLHTYAQNPGFPDYFNWLSDMAHAFDLSLSKVNAGEFYAAMYWYGLLHTTDDLKTYTRVYEPAEGEIITSVALSEDEETVYFCSDRAFYRYSPKSGEVETIRQFAGSVRAKVFTRGNTVLCKAYGDIIVSFDGGETWASVFPEGSRITENSWFEGWVMTIDADNPKLLTLCDGERLYVYDFSGGERNDRVYALSQRIRIQTDMEQNMQNPNQFIITTIGEGAYVFQIDP